MATISIFESITLDGVMQGLGRPDEDTRGGFPHGGWGDGYTDEVSMKFVGESMSNTGAMLFGRRTYEDLLGFWTKTTLQIQLEYRTSLMCPALSSLSTSALMIASSTAPKSFFF